MAMSVSLPKAVASVEEGIEAGLHIGAQLYISRHGQPVADLAVGDARPASERVTMTPDHLVLWMSACKPVTAIAVTQQVERGTLNLDARVADYLPDFAEGGKAGITLRHVLTHTGGFRPTPFNHPEDDWDTIIAKICAMPLERGWQPGEKAGYHVHTGWFILAELLQRASGERFSDYVRGHIFEPLGMNDSWIGMPAERFDAYGDRIAVMMDTSKPASGSGAKPWIDPAQLKAWVTHPRPSGNGYGPVRELGRFYEMLLNGGEFDGTRIVEQDTVAAFTARQRVEAYDHTFRHTMDWGLGFMVDSKRHGAATVPYGFGDHASERTFGHGGSQSSTAFADLDHGLVVAIVCNGMPGEPKHQRRMREVLRALYEDLGLAAP